MAPAATDAPHNASTVKSENAKSLKVLEELLGKLNISESQDQVNAAALDLATFVNGDIEEADAPTKCASTQRSETRNFADIF